MKVKFIAAAASVMFVVGAAQANEMTVATWGGSYTEQQRKTIMDPFTAETGTAVLDATYTGGLGQLRAMSEAGNAQWDVVQMEAADLIQACSEGLVEKLDQAKLTNLADLGHSVSECGVGAVGWSIVIGYNSAKTDDAPKTWADFWDVKKFPGKRALRRSPQYALEAALLADGVAPDKLYEVLGTPEGVDQAFKKLDQIKGDLQWWEAGSQPAEWLASGEVVMSTSYVGRLVNAASEGAPVKFGWAGAMYSVDSWAIVANAKNQDGAYAFLNYATSPKPQAAFSELNPVAPTNAKAEELLPEARRAILPLGANLAENVPFSDSFWIDNSEALTARFTAWLNQ